MNSPSARRCPEWCSASHDDTADPEHRDAGIELPVIALQSSGLRRAEGVTLLLLLHQRDTDTAPWLYLGDGTEHRMELSLESMRRVLETVSRRLAALGLDSFPEQRKSFDPGAGSEPFD